jgi:hypothetical protein
LNWYGIWLLSKLGLARDVYRYKLSSREQSNKIAAVPIQIVARESESELISA